MTCGKFTKCQRCFTTENVLVAGVPEEELEEGADETMMGDDDLAPEHPDPIPEPLKKKRKKGKVARDSDYWVCVERWLMAQIKNCGGDRASEDWKRCVCR
jgi:hypothetical protein